MTVVAMNKRERLPQTEHIQRQDKNRIAFWQEGREREREGGGGRKRDREGDRVCERERGGRERHADV